MILIIDTTDRQVAFGLKKNQTLLIQIFKQADIFKSFSSFLKRYRFNIDDIDIIIVNHGPGYFTSTRIGVTFANTFSYIEGIPLIGVSAEHKNVQKRIKLLIKKSKYISPSFAPVFPIYNKPPNITYSK